MTLLKRLVLFAFITTSSLLAVADPASVDQKLALILAQPGLLEQFELSLFDERLGSESSPAVEEGSISLVDIKIETRVQSYEITRDGGGQIKSIILKKTTH